MIPNQIFDDLGFLIFNMLNIFITYALRRTVSVLFAATFVNNICTISLSNFFRHRGHIRSFCF